VKEGNQALLAQLNEGLAMIRQSGEYHRISSKWLGILEPRRHWKEFLPGLIAIFGVLIALLGFLLAWNWTLEKEVRRKTEELRIANEQLRQIGEFKTQIVNSVAHEFKTPLGVIQGYLDYLVEGSVGPLSEKQIFIGRKIERVLNRLVRLVTDLLDVAKLEAGKISLDIKSVQAASLAEEVSSFFQEQIRHRKIRFTKKVNPAGLTFYGDPARLEECLINLVDNAIKYSDEGGEVDLAIFGEDNRIRFEVRDRGQGIPLEALEKIFERFARFDSEGVAEGYGLGLAIVRDFVELHQGRIWAESKPGEGSKFIFEIPKDIRNFN
jgi:signal transduction histidine kinase